MAEEVKNNALLRNCAEENIRVYTLDIIKESVKSVDLTFMFFLMFFLRMF